MASPTQEKTRTEQFKVEGDRLLAETKRLIKEGMSVGSASSKVNIRYWNCH